MALGLCAWYWAWLCVAHNAHRSSWLGLRPWIELVPYCCDCAVLAAFCPIFQASRIADISS